MMIITLSTIIEKLYWYLKVFNSSVSFFKGEEIISLDTSLIYH